jgi:hypothetical protein
MRQIMLNAFFECLNFFHIENTAQHDGSQALITFDRFGWQ